MKRKLRPSIRKTLEIITITLGICLLSLHDFELSALPLLIAVCALEIANIKILEKF